MGLASQLVNWPEQFCRKLAEKGHYVNAAAGQGCLFRIQRRVYRAFSSGSDKYDGYPICLYEILVLIIVSARRHLVPTLCLGTHVSRHA